MIGARLAALVKLVLAATGITERASEQAIILHVHNSYGSRPIRITSKYLNGASSNCHFFGN